MCCHFNGYNKIKGFLKVIGLNGSLNAGVVEINNAILFNNYHHLVLFPIRLSTFFLIFIRNRFNLGIFSLNSIILVRSACLQFI